MDILIVGAATAAGFTTGWLLRPAKKSALSQERKWRAQEEQYKQQIAAALNETSNVRNQVAIAKGEAATFKLEAAQANRDLELAREESTRANEALAQLQGLAARIAEDVGHHNSRMQEINDELKKAKDPRSVVGAVAKLIAANAKMQEQLVSAEEKLKNQAEELETHIAEARTDSLTGLCNRRAFDLHMSELQEQFRTQGQPSSVMMLDVDHFKRFNDMYGHRVGDEVLRGVARVLKENVSGDVIVCRYGGEEFAIIYPGCDLNTARSAAERLRSILAESNFQFEKDLLCVTASSGLAEFINSETVDDLVKRADDALYACKAAGRNCGHYHDGNEILPLTERLLATRKVDELAATNRDPLTGLSARDSLMEDLERRLAQWRRGGAELAMILVEIDSFDRLLSVFGQSAGDTMLKATSQFLKAAMRDMDHVARWDQRRFALLLPGATRSDASGVAERLRNAIESCKLPTAGGVMQFTISVGITQLMKDDTSESVIERVDQLVSEALAQGGNRSLIAELEVVETMS
jgi:diguanylate cyclase